MQSLIDLLDDFFIWLDDMLWRMSGGWREDDKKWRRTFVIIPKRSPEGRLVWLRCWKRSKTLSITEYADPLMTHRIVMVYAHKREVFKDMLKEGTK